MSDSGPGRAAMCRAPACCLVSEGAELRGGDVTGSGVGWFGVQDAEGGIPGRDQWRVTGLGVVGAFGGCLGCLALRAEAPLRQVGPTGGRFADVPNCFRQRTKLDCSTDRQDWVLD